MTFNLFSFSFAFVCFDRSLVGVVCSLLTSGYFVGVDVTDPGLTLCTEDPDVRTRKIVKVVTQTMINGKVVDESSEVEQIEERKKN